MSKKLVALKKFLLAIACFNSYHQIMCGRFRLKRLDLIAAGLTAIPKFEEFSETRITPGFKEFTPFQLVPIVYVENQKRVIDSAKWGFVRSQAVAPQSRNPIHARAETVATNGLFREAFRSSRCLMPADGFYEPQGPKTMKRRPQFYFHRPDEEMFAMAGIWSRTVEANTCE